MSDSNENAICHIPTELGRGNLLPPQGLTLEAEYQPGKTFADLNRDGLSLNDLKRLYLLPEAQRPTFEIELGNGTRESVTLDEYLKAELLPRHQMVLAYWLAGLRRIATTHLPPRDIVRHRLYYPGMFPASISNGAAHYVNDNELDHYRNLPIVEQVMAVLWREIGSAYVGKANTNYGPQSGIWGGNKEVTTRSGTISEIIQYFRVESKADVLREQIEAIEESAGLTKMENELSKIKKQKKAGHKEKAAALNEEVKKLRNELKPRLKPLKDQLKGVADVIEEELQAHRGTVLHRCGGTSNAAVQDVDGSSYNMRFEPQTEANSQVVGGTSAAARFSNEVYQQFNELAGQFPDQSDLDRYLLETKDIPNRNALRELNRRMYERRLRNAVV